MKGNTKTVITRSGAYLKRHRIHFFTLLAFLFLAALVSAAAGAPAEWPQVTYSRDGTPITYEVYGKGEPTLVFVHGWSCDSRYWRAQVARFAAWYRVVTLDLAGHGHSGSARSRYTMASFGEDVRAVVEATGSRAVILVGHSMGGSVIAEAARVLPGRVLGLIGVDTLENVEYPLTREELEGMTAALRKDFAAGSRQFVGEMFSANTDRRIREWVLSDMSSALPEVALSAMDEMMSQYVTGEVAKIFETLPLPVVTVNADLWPVNVEANRRHMSSYDAIILRNSDHFLMMNQPKRFNRALERAIRMILEKTSRSVAAEVPQGL
jgi:pimeloyl-ACP methyl ester carboxylesterase